MKEVSFEVEIVPDENLVYIGNETGTGCKYSYNPNDTVEKQEERIKEIIGEYLENYCSKEEVYFADNKKRK